MKNHIIKLLLFLTVGVSQQNWNVEFMKKYGGLTYSPNSNKPYTGKVFDLYKSNGNKKVEGYYKDGNQDREWTYWYENGQKKLERTYKDGELDGLWTYWDENGQKYSEITFKNGKVPPKLSNFTPHRLFINEATCLQCHQSERTMNFGAGPVVAKKMIHEFRENCVTCHLMPK